MTEQKVKYYELVLTGEVYTIYYSKKKCKAKFICNTIDFCFDIENCPDLSIGDKILIKAKYSKDNIFINEKH